MKRWLSLLVFLMLAVAGLTPGSQAKAVAGVKPSTFVKLDRVAPLGLPEMAISERTLGEYPEVCEGVRGYQDGYSLLLTLESAYPRHSYYVSSTSGLIETSVELGGRSSLEESGTVLPPTDYNGFRQFTIEWAQGPAQYSSSIYISFDPAMGEREVQIVVEPQIPGMMDCYVHLPWTSGFQEVPGCLWV